jgi:hypothetical protein
VAPLYQKLCDVTICVWQRLAIESYKWGEISASEVAVESVETENEGTGRQARNGIMSRIGNVGIGDVKW